MRQLSEVINEDQHPIRDKLYQHQCRTILERDGVVTLPNFLTSDALQQITKEAIEEMPNAYYCQSRHTVYLTESPDPKFVSDTKDMDMDMDIDMHHPRHREVISSKGCICDDQVGKDSALRFIYHHPLFQEFIAATVQVHQHQHQHQHQAQATMNTHSTNNPNPNRTTSTPTDSDDVPTTTQKLYAYADPLSSINVHYYHKGQELGWHFDNSEFAVTLLLQKSPKGARFEYVRDVRLCHSDSETSPPSQQTNQQQHEYTQITNLLNGELSSKNELTMNAGTLVLFRGRHSIHRVSPNESDTIRILAVLAYNSEPGIALSESARTTFYGRLG